MVESPFVILPNFIFCHLILPDHRPKYSSVHLYYQFFYNFIIRISCRLCYQMPLQSIET